MADIEPKDFRELVRWACWQVIQGITAGEKLERVMFGVLQYAAQWQREHQAKQVSDSARRQDDGGISR